MNELITTSFEDFNDLNIIESSFKKIVRNKLYLEFDP